MRAIHLNEAAHLFSGYAARHPFHAVAEVIAGMALIGMLSTMMVAIDEPTAGTSSVTQAPTDAQTAPPPKWVWEKRVDRGLHLYPMAP